MKKLVLKISALLTIVPLIGCNSLRPEFKNLPEEDENCVIPTNAKDYENFTSLTFKVRQNNDDMIYSENFRFDNPFHYITTGNPKIYNQNVEQLAVLTVYEISYYGHISLLNPKTNKFECDGTPMSFQKYIGFKDPRMYTDKFLKYTNDPNDINLMSLSHQEFEYDNKKHQVFLVSLSGSYYQTDWASNFDVGYTNSVYSNDVKTDHPEWLNYKHHKAFDVATNRLSEHIDNYVNCFKDSNAELTYCFFGHSRGASIANLLGKKYSDLNLRNFTYTIAATNVTEGASGSYPSIFNIKNQHDIVPCIIPDKLNFARYGTTLEFALDDSIEDDYEKTFPFYSFSQVNVDPFVNCLCDLFGSSRENLFTLNDDSKFYFDIENAQKFIQNYNVYFTKLGNCSRRVIVDDKIIEGLLGYTVNYHYARALVLDMMQLIFLSKNPYDVVDVIKAYVPFLSFAVTSVLSHLDMISNIDINGFAIGHVVETYMYHAFKK